MHERLRAALDLVLADVRATTDVELGVGDYDASLPDGWAGAMVWTAGGSGTGVFITLNGSLINHQVEVADKVQDLVAEELWARASNWPICPAHPGTHPLNPREVDGVARWVCPRDGTAISDVGALRAASSYR